jgi:leucyl/phenylalanyl-tRNA--protein transferase
MQPLFLPLNTPVKIFPDPTRVRGDIVAVGDNLFPDTIEAAYRSGCFPWPHEGYPLLWFSPLQRAILEFDRLHIPESLEKVRRKSLLRFTIDRSFPEVITACRTASRPNQEGTWITPDIRSAYIQLHQRGVAHSVEAWDREGNLVGGLYGVDSGGVFAGESMFTRASNASKLALLYLIDHLSERGLDFIDIQQLTPHMEALGARELPRRLFLSRLKLTQNKKLCLFPSVTSLVKNDQILDERL